MPALNIELNQEQLKNVINLISNIKDGIPKVLARSINTAADGAKTDMVFIVREQYNYKAGALRDRINVKKATYTNLKASTISIGGPMHLTDVAGTSWAGPQAPGTKVNVKKSTGSQTIKSAWIGKARSSGKEIVYIRTSDPGKSRRKDPPGRYPIKALYAPHPEIIYNQEHVWKSVQYLADYTLSNALEKETMALIKGYS